MIILAVETSCDDTGIAILEIREKLSSPFKILSNVVSSQVKLHKKYGGVYPSLAKREHQKNLPLVLEKALKEAKNPKLDLLAVTIGPGLEPCLWTGINFAIDLAKKMNLPLVPVNHVEAHILVNFINGPWMKTHDRRFLSREIFPAVCLVVSGGHTQLILMKSIGNYKILGETRDDAAGECLDKTARILGLEYPGGPAIAEQARQWKSKFLISNFQTNSKSQITKIKLPRPMIYTKDYDFSFSGLKTAVLYEFKKRSPKIRGSKKYIREMCFEVQQAVIDVLIKKTMKAAKNYKAKSIIIGGGVAANKELRKQFAEKIRKEIPYSKFYIPDSEYCTDNGLMAAIAAYYRRKGKTKNWKKIRANANLKIGSHS